MQETNAFIPVGPKLLYVLPIAPGTRRALLAGVRAPELADALTAVGIDVESASVTDGGEILVGATAGTGQATSRMGGRYDLIVLGMVPRAVKARERLALETRDALSPGSGLALIVENRLGAGRPLAALIEGLRGAFSRGDRAAAFAPDESLRFVRAAGLSGARLYVPFPDIEHPAVFVSVERPEPLEFLMKLFPDFGRRRSGIFGWAARRLVSLNVYRFFADRYVVLARDAGRKEGR